MKNALCSDQLGIKLYPFMCTAHSLLVGVLFGALPEEFILLLIGLKLIDRNASIYIDAYTTVHKLQNAIKLNEYPF